MSKIVITAIGYVMIGPVIGLIVFLLICSLATGQIGLLKDALNHIIDVLAMAYLFGSVPALLTGVCAACFKQTHSTCWWVAFSGAGLSLLPAIVAFSIIGSTCILLIICGFISGFVLYKASAFCNSGDLLPID